jgi:DNA topoisomerase II
MLPWWRGFNGTIKKSADNKYEVTGIVKKLNDTTVEITELPIHKWPLPSQPASSTSRPNRTRP